MGISPKVGDEVWVGKNNCDRRMEFKYGLVTKVGRKFFTVNLGSERFPVETRFEVGCKDGASDSNARESNYRDVVWSSRGAYEAHAEFDAAKLELCDMFTAFGTFRVPLPDSVTTDGLRTVIRILKGGK